MTRAGYSARLVSALHSASCCFTYSEPKPSRWCTPFSFEGYGIGIRIAKVYVADVEIEQLPGLAIVEGRASRAAEQVREEKAAEPVVPRMRDDGGDEHLCLQPIPEDPEAQTWPQREGARESMDLLAHVRTIRKRLVARASDGGLDSRGAEERGRASRRERP